MITAIEIENFKAFGERQRIELRPITLLFGPNSGGKSSVTHALHYLREVLCEGTLDPHRTWSGGDAVDLGGIRTFVHGRQVGAIIKLKAEFSLSGVELPEYHESDLMTDATSQHRDLIRGRVSSASVEFEIQADTRPWLRVARIALNGDQIGEIRFPPDQPHAEVGSIAWRHQVLSESDADHESTDSMSVGMLASLCEAAGGAVSDGSILPTPRPAHGLPRLDAPLSFPSLAGEPHELATQIPGADLPYLLRLRFESMASMLLLGPIAVLRSRLEGMRYVGPLRTMPARHFEPRDRSGPSRWATGLQAWELLAHGRKMTPARREGEGSLLEEVSKWLEAEDRLDTGYRLEREEFKQVPSNIAAMVSDPEFFDRIEILAEKIKSLPDQARIVLRDVGRNLLLQPQDVGVGLSQIVPVIVALLDPGGPLVALEQPELHLHPRQQAALGDAIIKGMTATPNRVLLIETHSEHLILRLLRRIRETTRRQALSEQLLTPDQLRIQYVRREGSVSRAQTIDVDVNGDLVDPWPDDFFEQDFKERFS